MANPLGYPDLLVTVAAMERRIRELERRRYPAPPQNLDELDDCQVSYGHSTAAPSDGDVLTWAAGSTPFGGLWQPAAPADTGPPGSPYMGTWSDDGIFDEVAPFNFSAGIIVDPGVCQLVIVTAEVAVSDVALSVFGGDEGAYVNAPTPWRLWAENGDTGAQTGAMGCGSGMACCAMWAVNTDPDEYAGPTIGTAVESATGDPLAEFDGTVEITVRTVYTLLNP